MPREFTIAQGDECRVVRASSAEHLRRLLFLMTTAGAEACDRAAAAAWRGVVVVERVAGFWVARGVLR